MPTPETLARENWESYDLTGGTGWLGASWTKSGSVDVTSSATPHGGAFHVRLRGEDTHSLKRNVDLSERTQVRLKFWAKVTEFDESGDSAVVRVSPNGSSFTTVQAWTLADSDNSYREYDLDLSGFEMTSQFVIEFRLSIDDSDDAALYLDDIEVTGVSSGQ